MHTDQGSPHPDSTLRTLTRAIFLAVSWTWCIGMFLPIILIRDHGPWAFLVFALPNIVGAAAMGWMLRTSAQSSAIIASHRPALAAFSLVTIAFHVYWLTWLGTWLAPAIGLSTVPIAIIAVAWLVATAVLATRSASGLMAAAIPVWLVSINVFIALLPHLDTIPPTLSMSVNPQGLVWLAPVCLFGFALCPYLDLTFHAARRGLSERSSRIAFSIGFGFFFAAMILFTYAYAPLLDASFTALTVPTWLAAAITLHLLLQATFTVLAHSKACFAVARPPVGAIVFFALVGIASVAAAHVPDHAGLSASEIGYRAFMSFYGLAFPAYVWLVMIPTRSPAPDRRRRSMLVWAAAVGIAAPMYWMGFIERQDMWLGFGLAVVLLARLALPRSQAATAS